MGSYEDVLGKLEAEVVRHNSFYKNSLPLIASENLTCSITRKYYSSDLGHRYAEGKIGERFYQGCDAIDEIEQLALDLTKKLFKAEHANVQPISGVVANIAAFFALTKPSDLIMAISVPCGGHISHDRFSAAGIRGLKVEYYPFNVEEMEIDVDETKRVARKLKPRVFVLGSSLILFPQPVKELAELASEFNSKVLYDASHVLGLIAGGEFQDPLREGADVVTASTHKTFFGPQRAIILSKKELAEEVDKAVFPGVVSNHHLNTLAALVVSLAEMLEFGKDYASQVVKNAKRLAEKLYDLGFKVIGESRGFTASHQVAVDVSDLGGGSKVAKSLERINIVLNKNLLPWDDVSKSPDPSGIRIGVQEVTRLGMKEDEMEEIAEIIHSRLVKGDGEVELRQRVRELKQKFSTIKYTFEEEEAYVWG
ncbi:serine hydroxymethyltransferase [Archaeoglobales archaeon]|nr:MAG: serine hydroxymethyltransferase [Archaeoglobales archaeon]